MADPRPEVPTPCALCGYEGGGAYCPGCGTRHSRTTQPQPYVGMRIADRFEVGELLRLGGMGRVHRGVQTALGRAVAIKFIHPHLLDAQEIVQRFIVEARAASCLSHPNIVRVLDFGRLPESDGGVPYTVMELLSGVSLADVLAQQPRLPIERIVPIVLQVLGALDEAHSHGVIHRDVKPENVVLERIGASAEHVKVIDFGLARIHGTSRITAAGLALGTPGFMAPEQFSGGRPTPATDLYAVGAMLFESITGRLPFVGPSIADVALAQVSEPCPDPRSVYPDLDVSDALVDVLRRALAPDPAARFESAAEFSVALSAAMERVLTAHARGAFVSRAERAPTVPMNALEPAALSGERAKLPALAPEMPLLERAPALAWARAWLGRERGGESALLWGTAGAGRSRMLREIGRLASAQGWRVCIARADPAPASRGCYSGIAKILAALLGGEVERVHGRLSSPEANRGLRVVFDRDDEATGAVSEFAAVGAALEAVAQMVATRSPHSKLLLAIDDLQRFDRPSRGIFERWQRERLHPQLSVIATLVATAAPADPRWGEQCAVGPISTKAAASILGAYDFHGERVIDPRTLDTLRRWAHEQPEVAPPGPLAEIVAARIEALAPHARRVLEAVAVAGRIERTALAPLVGTDVDGATLQALGSDGFVVLDADVVIVAHDVVAEAALAMLSAGVAASLHAAVPRTAAPELRAYHALRAHADFAAFLLAERAIDRLERRGDAAGAEALLIDAVRAARSQWGRSGEDDAAAAWIAFARRHAAMLLASGDAERAFGVLAEVVDLPACTGTARTRVLELLATAAAQRGWTEVSERYARESRA